MLPKTLSEPGFHGLDGWDGFKINAGSFMNLKMLYLLREQSCQRL